MKISELVATLKSIGQGYGDLQVVISAGDKLDVKDIFIQVIPDHGIVGIQDFPY